MYIGMETSGKAIQLDPSHLMNVLVMIRICNYIEDNPSWLWFVKIHPETLVYRHAICSKLTGSCQGLNYTVLEIWT